MRPIQPPVVSRLEENVLRFFSPDGLLTVVSIVILMALLLGGMGIEHRTMDMTAADQQRVTESPLLSSAD